MMNVPIFSIVVISIVLLPLAGCSQTAAPQLSSPTHSVVKNTDTDSNSVDSASPNQKNAKSTPIETNEKERAASEPFPKHPAQHIIRIATYNVSLHRKKAGQLVRDLSDPNHLQAKRIAEIVQRIRPDVLLINEIDYQDDGTPAELLRDNFFAQGQNGLEPVDFPYIYAPSSNTGMPSGLDLNRNGRSSDPQDCFGFGTYPGQYALAVFSRFPIDGARNFQQFLWTQLPGAVNPQADDSESPYYSDEVWNQLRLSSKNHCDVSIRLPKDVLLHFLVSHPTPPVFDGREDRNGLRNADEIRFWTHYISRPSSAKIVDDAGAAGGLDTNAYFAIAGDLNSDPLDGDSRHAAINELIQHDRVTDPMPQSPGGMIAGQSGKNDRQQSGNPATDTSRWSSGNYRVDYVLPSSNFEILDSGVFWPTADEPTSDLLKASDHRPVWVDVEL